MPVSVISRLLNVLGFNSGSQQEDLGEKIEHTIIKLEIIEDRVAELRYRFEQRSRELFEKIITLLRRGERSRATIYAGEVSQIKNILKMIVAIENLILMTKERLKTVRDTRELGRVLMAFGTALEGVKDQIVAVYPNLNLAFDEISRSARSLIVETSVEAVGELDPAIVSNEAMKILDEALKKAEEKIKEEFPEPPVAPVIPTKALREPVAIPIGTPRRAFSHRRPAIEEVENLVLSYIREHNGYLDIRDFTAKYNVDKSTVLQALYRLAEKGLVAIQ